MMHFIWYIVVLVLFYLIFWHLLSLPLSIAGIGFVIAITWVTENKRTLIKKILKPPIYVLGYIFGTLLITAVYGIGVAAITANFAYRASHPLLYYVLGGLTCLTTMAAPSGETGCLATLQAVVFYIVTMFFIRANTFLPNTIISVLVAVAQVIIGVFIVSFVGGAIIALVSKLRRKTT